MRCLCAGRGVKCLSFGYVNPKAGPPGAGGQQAAVMRGPIVTKVINQLTSATDWGDIDYLVSGGDSEALVLV